MKVILLLLLCVALVGGAIFYGRTYTGLADVPIFRIRNLILNGSWRLTALSLGDFIRENGLPCHVFVTTNPEFMGPIYPTTSVIVALDRNDFRIKPQSRVLRTWSYETHALNLRNGCVEIEQQFPEAKSLAPWLGFASWKRYFKWVEIPYAG